MMMRMQLRGGKGGGGGGPDQVSKVDVLMSCCGVVDLQICRFELGVQTRQGAFASMDRYQSM